MGVSCSVPRVSCCKRDLPVNPNEAALIPNGGCSCRTASSPAAPPTSPYPPPTAHHLPPTAYRPPRFRGPEAPPLQAFAAGRPEAATTRAESALSKRNRASLRDVSELKIRKRLWAC
ncbi:Protein of unknown function [Gryllus bimaculatus]|nr:Protein of unknown function [Gryllus bimaculatus]